MNVFNLDLNVAMESSFFNEAGNLFRRRGATYKAALSEKHRYWHLQSKRIIRGPQAHAHVNILKI